MRNIIFTLILILSLIGLTSCNTNKKPIDEMTREEMEKELYEIHKERYSELYKKL